MDLVSFCRAHGILIDSLPPVGIWKRYPTDDHPRKRNGAVKYMGTHAFVQNHATETAISVWKPDGQVDTDKYRRMNQDAESRHRMAQERAAEKARFILSKSAPYEHPYLAAKGFPKERGLVYQSDDLLLVVPMRVAGRTVGCQLIAPDGSKRFLFGQRTSGATHTLDAKGVHVLCEGYATALSVQAALRQLKIAYRIHVCFSAGNLVKVALALPGGVVIADNDASQTGQKAAEATGWPYWVSDSPGEDANDAHQRLGLFRFSQSLGAVFRSAATKSRGSDKSAI